MPVVRFVVVAIAKVLSKVFGLATMAFFGRMPSRDDDIAAAIGLASITWIPFAVAVAVPEVGEWLIPFAPDDESALRGIAIGGTVLLPLGVGLAAGHLHNRRQDDGSPRWLSALHGFWYAPLIGGVVTGLIVVVPVLKFKYLVRRYEVQRLLVMIPAGSFDDVIDHVVEALDRRGIATEVGDPGRVMGGMFRLLVFVLGHLFARDVADRLVILRGTDADDAYFEVTVHAADLTIVGPEKAACRVRAVLAEELDERVVYFTWDESSQSIEDRMRDQRERLEAGEQPDLDEVRQLGEDLATVHLDSEEWNNVRRNLYRLERDTYADLAGERDPADATRAVQRRPAGTSADD